MSNHRGHYSETREGDVVYVMRRANGDLKFGVAQKLRARWAKLCGEYGEHLEILATMPGYTNEERMIQERFAEHRIFHIRASSRKANVRTDWFMPAPKIYEWIVENMTPYTERLSRYRGATDGLLRYYNTHTWYEFNQVERCYIRKEETYCVLPHMDEYPLKHTRYHRIKKHEAESLAASMTHHPSFPSSEEAS